MLVVDKEEEEKPKSTKTKPTSAMIDAIVDNSPTFPEKLMELLQNEVATDAIWWLPDNESFGINKKIFEEKSEYSLREDFELKLVVLQTMEYIAGEAWPI